MMNSNKLRFNVNHMQRGGGQGGCTLQGEWGWGGEGVCAEPLSLVEFERFEALVQQPTVG